MLYLIGETSNGHGKLADTYPRGIGRCYVERPLRPFDGEPWFLDNGVFRAWNQNDRDPSTDYADTYERFERKMVEAAELAAQGNSPLFVVVPDRPADPASIWTSLAWVDEYQYGGGLEESDPWAFAYGTRHGAVPLYLAVQDGMTPEQLEALVDPETDEPALAAFSGLFLGGSDDFKASVGIWRDLATRWGLKLHYGRCTQSRIAAARDAGCDSADSSHPNRLGGARWERFLEVYDAELGAPQDDELGTSCATSCAWCGGPDQLDAFELPLLGPCCDGARWAEEGPAQDLLPGRPGPATS